mmetsp:Transcript_1771/g.3049  ORF Transcript_1771/g.3049 Transcript_1771/m.3049 type:complete len:259 (+) Transcript_1771:188-964(+)|eukprot:CAMPEP_0198210568 /NCGR_PEP_ID=MMETSP1445-20131203/20705_1 /TAXON_ID=36898 /ORGANISM="Pyramimonas sp., Strain CCMP2087" /LENGTH=258 /DNA_ID=CAMNT_0043884657 /DNA_START=127 /DNA_END=903 /DNA_ORIENTATION=-
MKGTTSKSLLKVKKTVSIEKKRNQNATIKQKEQAQGDSSLEGEYEEYIADTNVLVHQASLLCESYCKSLKAESASFLEKDAFSVDSLVQLPTSKPRLEQKLQLGEAQFGLDLCHIRKPCKHAGKGGKKGCPSVLVLTSSAKRALELMRELPHYNQACRIHKLFAKHIKVEEQAQLLKKFHICMAVGTPNRVQKLADEDALDVSQLKLIVLDMRLDAKKRDLLTLSEVRDDFWSLYRTHFREKVQGGGLKFAMAHLPGV